jgi:hypothetical protein
VGGSGSNALTFSYTVAAGENTSDLTVSSLNLNNATVQNGAGTPADVSGATSYNPAGTLQIDTTAPTIAINTIASNNVVTHSYATSGFSISGTTVGAENGQTVTVTILNSANTVVDNYATTDQSNAWSVNVTSAQATALADGGYTVTASVADKAGNPAQVGKALTVDEEKVAETPVLTIANTSPTVPAGGSVALGITATPADSDDVTSVRISGVPTYETISAPSGDTVTHQAQRSTNIWTITESASMSGTPLTGLTLTSHYTGTGHPVATLTVTASNTTSGEAATTASRTIQVTDPPASTPSLSKPTSSAPAVDEGRTHKGHNVALFDQFVAAGFHNDPVGGQITASAEIRGGLENVAFLSSPHH